MGYSPWGHRESDTTKATEHACMQRLGYTDLSQRGGGLLCLPQDLRQVIWACNKPMYNNHSRILLGFEMKPFHLCEIFFLLLKSRQWFDQLLISERECFLTMEHQMKRFWKTVLYGSLHISFSGQCSGLSFGGCLHRKQPEKIEIRCSFSMKIGQFC